MYFHKCTHSFACQYRIVKIQPANSNLRLQVENNRESNTRQRMQRDTSLMLRWTDTNPTKRGATGTLYDALWGCYFYLFEDDKSTKDRQTVSTSNTKSHTWSRIVHFSTTC